MTPFPDSGGYQTMHSPLSAVLRRTPVTCPPQTKIRSALETMYRLRIGSMVITGEGQTPLGIFTLHDLLNRVALPALDMEQPIERVMSANLITLPPQAPAYQAALAMARHGVRHVLLVEHTRLVGVVSENDLFSLQRIGFREISASIQAASDREGLCQLSRDIQQLAQNMLTQGVAIAQLTQFVSMLNELLTQRIIELEFAGVDPDGIRFCWIALGSEGRFEQTLSSDQDNGIIFNHPSSIKTEEARQMLLAKAQRINQALDGCGFPLCKGNIMAGNPMWCLSLPEWKGVFSKWIDHGDPEALLNASIFFDFRPVYGEASLAGELREWLTAHASKNPRFLHQMAANALRNRPPLGLIRDFQVEHQGDHPDTIDLKLRGTHLFVDAARIFSLATQVQHTNTQQRLRAAAGTMRVPQPEVEAWIEAFDFVLLLRLRNQVVKRGAGKTMDNYLNPRELNELERHFLKQSLRQAQKIQSRLALDYQL